MRRTDSRQAVTHDERGNASIAGLFFTLILMVLAAGVRRCVSLAGYAHVCVQRGE